MKEDEILLRDILDDHSRNPNGVSKIANPSITQKWVSTKTGNSCILEVVLDNKKIKQISARVEGSALAKACASIMCDELMDLSLEEANSLKNNIFTWIFLQFFMFYATPSPPILLDKRPDQYMRGEIST